MGVVEKDGVAEQRRHPNDFMAPSLILNSFRDVAHEGLRSS